MGWGGGKVRIARNLLVPVQVCRNEIVKFQSTLEALSTGEVPPRCALPNGILPSFPLLLLLPAHPSRGCSSFFPEEDVRFLPLFGADSNSAGKKEEVNWIDLANLTRRSADRADGAKLGHTLKISEGWEKKEGREKEGEGGRGKNGSHFSALDTLSENLR